MKPRCVNSQPQRVPGSILRERGASAVEFALVAPLFFTLVLGIMYGGIAFDRNNQIIHAAREGVRFGATLPVESSSGVPDEWFNSIRDVTVGAAAGQLGAAVTTRDLCIAYIGHAPVEGSTDDWTRVYREVDGSVSRSAGSASSPSSWCFDDGRGSNGERRVQVIAGRDTDFFVFVFSTTLSLSSDAVARFEAVA